MTDEEIKEWLEVLEHNFRKIFDLNCFIWEFYKYYIEIEEKNTMGNVALIILTACFDMLPTLILNFFQNKEKREENIEECLQKISNEEVKIPKRSNSVTFEELIRKLIYKYTKEHNVNKKEKCNCLLKKINNLKNKECFKKFKNYRDHCGAHLDKKLLKQEESLKLFFSKTDMECMLKEIKSIFIDLYDILNILEVVDYDEGDKIMRNSLKDFLKCLNLYSILNQEIFNCDINSYYREEKGEDKERVILEINKVGDEKVNLVTLKNGNNIKSDFLKIFYDLLQKNKSFLENINIKIEKNLDKDSKYPL